jgi:hypothetical protein
MKSVGASDSRIAGLSAKPAYSLLSQPSPATMASKKEQMIFMIINLVRSYPCIVSPHLQNMKQRCKMRQKSKSLHYKQEDVELALGYLTKEVKPAGALVYSHSLSIMCQEGLKWLAKQK